MHFQAACVNSNQYYICHISCILIHFTESFYSMEVYNCPEKQLCMSLLTEELAGLGKFFYLHFWFSAFHMGYPIPMLSEYFFQDLNGTFVVHFICPLSNKYQNCKSLLLHCDSGEKPGLNGTLQKDPYISLKNSNYNGLNIVLLDTIQLLLLYKQQKNSHCIITVKSVKQKLLDSCIYKLIYSYQHHKLQLC